MIRKAKTLFPQTNFPIHNTFMKILYRYSTNKTYISRIDLEKLSMVLGREYLGLLTSIENIEKDNNSTEFLDLCLKLKIKAKKLKAATGNEFAEDRDLLKISNAINPFMLDIKNEEQELKNEQQQLKNRLEEIKAVDKEQRAQKMQEKLRLIEQQRAAKKARYLERFCEFPEFGLSKIKIGSYAANVLKRLQKNDANEQDYFWLKEKGFLNVQIIQAFRVFFLKRARVHLAKWQASKKPWNLVNAIADYRKGDSSRDVLEVIQANYPFRFSNGNKKLKSALLTTSGGVYRDLSQYEESLKLGNEANLLTPTDFRPCTLIGASNFLLGNISEGHLWYQKAIERGFKPEQYDNDLRAVYMRCNKHIKKELKSSLLAKGYRYTWLTN